MTAPLDFVVAIPARYASTRLPGKPLLLIAGEPMIVHVARRATEAGAAEVVVATDDERIADVIRPLGLQVCMTSPDHASGTDRLAECARLRGWADDRIVVNLQGDEPLCPPALIRSVADTLSRSGAPIATLAVPIRRLEDQFETGIVKVVVDDLGFALYFSRAPIPWDRDRFAVERTGAAGPATLRHIGLYAYRAGAIGRFAGLRQGTLERVEALEQLRALQAGWRIAVDVHDADFPAGVDTQADLDRVRLLLQG